MVPVKVIRCICPFQWHWHCERCPNALYVKVQSSMNTETPKPLYGFGILTFVANKWLWWGANFFKSFWWCISVESKEDITKGSTSIVGINIRTCWVVGTQSKWKQGRWCPLCWVWLWSAPRPSWAETSRGRPSTWSTWTSWTAGSAPPSSARRWPCPPALNRSHQQVP